MMEGYGSAPEKSPEKGGTMRVKSKKKKMLDLVPVETKMKNLQGVIQSQTLKMKNMKPLEPWKPVKSGEVIHSKPCALTNAIAHLMDMTAKKRKKGDGDEEEDNERRKEVKKKSIFDRENIFRKPYEVNE